MKNLILLISSIGLIIVGCSDEDNPTSSTITIIEGTYNMTDATAYVSEDCSGVGITGMCYTSETATTEAECVDVCMNNTGLIDAATEAACIEADGHWMGWVSYSVIIASQDESITLSDGVITYSEGGIPGTYTISGITISITDPAGCWNYDQEVAVEVTSEAACNEANSEWEEASTSYGTLNTDGTVSVKQISPEGCYDDQDENVEAATETICDETNGDWESASCMELIFTLSTDQ